MQIKLRLLKNSLIILKNHIQIREGNIIVVKFRIISQTKVQEISIILFDSF